ncbi:hypothetical protein [Moorena bouillonii]|uniref:hypothetical protein n=1 Tax=Moorena bouillonii TaxID=207920 RepID=UPI00117BF49E|nr:hypothetical protein [Moorena bouillonii]
MAYWPRYANNLQPSTKPPSTFNLQPSTCNLQPWPIGHATRTTFNLGLLATLREQPIKHQYQTVTEA